MTHVPASSHGSTFNGGTITQRLVVADPAPTHIGLEVEAPTGSIASAQSQILVDDENGNQLFSVGGDGSLDIGLEQTGSPSVTMRQVNRGALFVFTPGAGSGAPTFAYAIGVAGATYTVFNFAGNKVFEIRDDGSLHGLTGKALTFDL